MITLYLVDEVRVKFEGLRNDDIKYIISKTEKYVKGYFQKAEYKIGAWNGKESHFLPSGFTYFYMLDTVFPLLENLGYNVDKDIDIVDYREVYTQPDYIDEYYLKDYGIELRTLQKECVNEVIDNEKGIIKAGTASGKTLISLLLSKVYDSVGMKSINIVPSNNLVIQTYEYYKDKDIKACKITEKDNEDSIKDKLENYDHFVITRQKLQNIPHLFEDFHGVLIYDETHVMGDVTCSLLADTLSECPIRIGLTGSLPSDAQKQERIFCHIGGEVIYEVQAHELMQQGTVSTASITMVQTQHSDFHSEFDPKRWDWTMEERYLSNNDDRVQAIADYIQSMSKTNTMILCSRAMAENLSNKLGQTFIDGSMKTEERKYYYDLFENSDDNMLIASYGTSSTGLSIDRIFRLILIDVGKDSIKTIQSIGRGIRKDGVFNHVDVVDIYSDAKYSMRHKKERIKVYEKENYDYVDSKQKIIV